MKDIRIPIPLMILFLMILVVFFTNCDKKKQETGEITFSLYCAQENDIGGACIHLCDGRWARQINELKLYFETEKECLE